MIDVVKLNIDTVRMINDAKDEEERNFMIDILKLSVKNEMDGLESYFNEKWNQIVIYLEQAERFPQIIRYHAQLDVLVEMYCHYFDRGFDDGFDALNKVVDDLANKKIKQIQQEMTIYKLWLFD